VLDEEIPIPANTGKRIRSLSLLRRLSSRFHVDLLVHANGAKDERLRALRELGLTVHVANSRVPVKRGYLFYLGVAANLLSSLPYTVASHHQRGYRTLLEKLLAVNRYDLIHCEWTPYAVYRTEDHAPWVLSAHNIESEVWSRLSDAEPHPARRAFFALQARKMETFERTVFSSVGFATAVSVEDARRIQGWGCPRVRVVPNGVDLEECTPLSDAKVEPSDLLFVGSMDWRANQDAIRWFLSEIHPCIAALTDYRLWVVGRDPPNWLLDRAKVFRNIEVTGEVEDVRPYLERSAVVIVPLRIGGGSRLKILEAFACGRPVISTTIGAEGLDVKDGVELLLADSPNDFAEAVVRLLGDSRRRKKLAQAGRQLVEARYGWTKIAEIQAEFWSDVIEDSRQARKTEQDF
jgi:glycosyltransferase involved in cell wall biosynthesis